MTPSYIHSHSNISAVDALWAIIQQQNISVRKELTKRLLDNAVATKQEKQKAMVEKSLKRAFHELESGQVKKNARNLFSE